MSRSYRFEFVVECASTGTPDLNKAESMIDLAMQDLVFDDAFVAALDEQQSITIQVKRIG